jgi:hypothetical protein
VVGANLPQLRDCLIEGTGLVGLNPSGSVRRVLRRAKVSCVSS